MTKEDYINLYMNNENSCFDDIAIKVISKVCDEFESRSCASCNTNPNNCRIFYGANKQLALSPKSFCCSLFIRRQEDECSKIF